MRHDLISIFCTVDYKYILNKYCEMYGIPVEDLKRSCRIYKGVHIDWMRMCLSYHLREVLGLPTCLVSKSLGYKHHQAVIYNCKKVREYIEVKDPYIYPYWVSLKKVI